MKPLIVLYALIAYGSTAKFKEVEISTFQNSLKASAALGRIVNGQPATENQIPHQCSVLSPVGSSFSVCGGSIISSGWVLTAAHCTIGYSQHILRFGTITLTIGGQVQTAFTSISHPAYNSVNMNYDISVIPIPTPLTFTPAIQSIRLPSNSQIDSTFVDVTAVVSDAKKEKCCFFRVFNSGQDSGTVTVSGTLWEITVWSVLTDKGWGSISEGSGASQTLNWVNMRVISNTACMNKFGGAVVVPHVVCATGISSVNQGHCGGDSGGPLTIVEAGVLTQIGVVSFGAASGCDLGYPSGYMRTSNFIYWIHEITGIPIRP